MGWLNQHRVASDQGHSQHSVHSHRESSKWEQASMSRSRLPRNFPKGRREDASNLLQLQIVNQTFWRFRILRLAGGVSSQKARNQGEVRLQTKEKNCNLKKDTREKKFLESSNHWEARLRWLRSFAVRCWYRSQECKAQSDCSWSGCLAVIPDAVESFAETIILAATKCIESATGWITASRTISTYAISARACKVECFATCCKSWFRILRSVFLSPGSRDPAYGSSANSKC